MTIEIIIFAILLLTMNVLDSVTTHLAFKQYPDKDFQSEANPIMRSLMKKNKALAEIVKHGMILFICVYLVWNNDLTSLRLASLLLSMVVLNNTIIVVSRAITKKKVVSPVERLRRLIHLPEKYSYLLVIAILVITSVVIRRLVWG